MESWRVSMIPIIGDSSGGNGSVAIVISDPSPRTSSSFTIKTIATVALKAKPLHSLSKKRVIPQSYRPQNLDCRKLITISDGAISLIRFIRSDQKLDIFGEHFELPKSFIYTYVRAKIVTGLHQIHVYSGDDLVISFPYQLPAWVTPDS